MADKPKPRGHSNYLYTPVDQQLQESAKYNQDLLARMFQGPPDPRQIPDSRYAAGDYPTAYRKDLIDYVTTMPEGVGLTQDYKGPSRYIDTADLAGLDKVGEHVAHLLGGKGATPDIPKTVGIYGGNVPTTIAGATSLRGDRDISFSGDTTRRLLTGDTSVITDPYNGRPFQDDPYLNAQSTAGHEFAHRYIGKHGIQGPPQSSPSRGPGFWNGVKDFLAPRPYPLLTSRGYPYGDIAYAGDHFPENFYNSHAHQDFDSQAASIVGHIIGKMFATKQEQPPDLSQLK